MPKTKLRRIISGSVIAAVVIALCGASYALCENYFSFFSKPEKDPPAIVSDGDGNPHRETVDDSRPTEEIVRKKYVRITTATYLRAKSSYSAEHLALLDVGCDGLYLDEDEEYYKISYENNKTGWVLKDKSEIIEKDVTVRHIPKKPSDMPYSMADTSEGDRLEEILSGYAAVGASVAVIKDGNVAYHYEYGYANKEDKNNPVPVNVNTKYRIASISKVMTSMLAMAETEDGILDLDANLSDLFGYRFYNPKYPSTSLTMRMLLTHTAGLSTEEGLYSESIYAVASGEKYYRAMPGNSFAYSNLGMGIAGAAVEKAADQFLSVYARERFFVPMGIDASYDGSLLADTSLVADCYSNGRLSRTRESMTKPVGNSKTKPGEVFYLGQGNLLISAVDLARVSTILLNEGMYDGRQYLRSDTVQQMLAVHPVNTRTKYEQCIGIRKYAGLVENRTMYYHTGTFYGICALMAIDPSDRSGVIVITSGAHPARGDNTVFNVCNDVLQYCYSDII